MARPVLDVLYATKSVDSNTTAGDTELATKDATNGRAMTNFETDNVVPKDLKVVGISKRIFKPADAPVVDLETINRLCGVTVVHDQDEYLVEKLPLEAIPEHNAPAGGVQETQATAADGFNAAVVDGGRLLSVPGGVRDFDLKSGFTVSMLFHVWAALSGITTLKTWYVRICLWGINPDYAG